MDMGVLANPGGAGVLKAPKTQVQQYFYSASKNNAGSGLATQKFSPVTSYFGTGFKKIGAKDPLYNANQVFYGAPGNEQESQGPFFGRDRKSRATILRKNFKGN